MDDRRRGKTETQWLIFVITVLAILGATLLYIVLDTRAPEASTWVSLSKLLLNFLPSAIAAMSALALGFVLFSSRGIRIALGDNPSLTNFAVELVDHMRAVDKNERTAKCASDISGWWEMRDWRDSYPQNMAKEEVESRIKRAKEKMYSEDARLLHTGSVVTGSFSNKGNNGSVANYELHGRVEGNVFIADWTELTPDKNFPWFGSVQCVISEGAYEKTMLGRWIGISHDEREVHSGIWEWRQRKSVDEPSKQDWPTEV